VTLPFTNQSIDRPLADHGEHASDGAAAVCHHDLLAALDALEVLQVVAQLSDPNLSHDAIAIERRRHVVPAVRPGGR